MYSKSKAERRDQTVKNEVDSRLETMFGVGAGVYAVFKILI